MLLPAKGSQYGITEEIQRAYLTNTIVAEGPISLSSTEWRRGSGRGGA